MIEATISRFRPIMLTGISTVLGFIPDRLRRVLGADGLAIMGGLLVATVLTLIVVPALYVALFRIKRDDPGERAPAATGAVAAGA